VERCCAAVACCQLKESVLRSRLPANLCQLITKFAHQHYPNEPDEINNRPCEPVKSDPDEPYELDLDEFDDA